MFYADNFTFDADVYYIPVNNNIVSENCSLIGGLSGDTCFVNTGEALYKGIEGETTYAFNDDIMNGALRGLVAFVNGSVNSAKSQGLYLKQAPMWTAAAGLVYKRDGVKISLINKMVGPQYSDNAQSVNYKVHAYTNTDLTLGYDFGTFEADLGIYNLFNSRSILAIGERRGLCGQPAPQHRPILFPGVAQLHDHPEGIAVGAIGQSNAGLRNLENARCTVSVG